MEIIDSFLNKITMYKLTLYYLTGLLAVAVIYSYYNLLPYEPQDIILGTLIIVATSVIANYIFSKIYNAVTNVESVFITALIIALIIPLNFPQNIKFLIEAAVFSMGVKYLLTIDKRHLFNPAAAAVVIIALLTNFSATWWVGTPIMLPFVAIGGFLLARKIRREKLVYSFLIIYFLLVAAASVISNGNIFAVFGIWQHSILNSALLFFAFLMLTEPLTSPSTRKLQIIYGCFVACLYSTSQIRFIGFSFTPEMALVIGNVLSYIISPNFRLDLELKWKKQLSLDTFAFYFNKGQDLRFIPGQYLEWTLPHKNSDSRGNRRYFSIASSPTEQDLMMLVKFYNPSSSYKKKLISLNPGEKIIASQVAGDFTLPKDLKKPIVFIAGGVGIAPFRSIVKYIIDNSIFCNIVLFYSNRTEDEIVFKDLFNDAKGKGIKTVFTLTDKNNIPVNWQGKIGYISEEMLKEEMSDYKQRIYYVSGPQLMVQGIEKTLKNMGIKNKQIITDFFPGYSER